MAQLRIFLQNTLKLGWDGSRYSARWARITPSKGRVLLLMMALTTETCHAISKSLSGKATDATVKAKAKNRAVAAAAERRAKKAVGDNA